MMRVLYTSNIDIRMEGADKTRFVAVIQNLARIGHSVLMLVPGYTPRRPADYGFVVRYVPTFRKSILAYLWAEFLKIPFSVQAILSFRPDVMYTPQGLFDLALPLVARLFRIPYVIEKHGIMEDEFRFRGVSEFVIKTFRLAEGVNYRLSNKIICVTEGIRRELNSRYGVPESKMVVIPNGANVDLFKPMNKNECRRKLQLDDRFFYVGFIGSFAPWQGLDTLVKATKQVKDQGYSELRFLLVGDGEQELQLRKEVEESGLSQEVIFTGRVPYKEIVYYINAFDVAVAPFASRRNSVIGLSPLKIYEYFACGCPVITTTIDGVRQIVEECRGGFLIEPDSASELAQKIVQTYEERETLEEQGRRARRLIEEKYSWLQVAKRVADVLEQVVRDRV